MIILLAADFFLPMRLLGSFFHIGGAALGVILAVLQFRSGKTDLFGCLMIILLAADFFLPMRLLGSFFHIAMNGMAASEKIFHLLAEKQICSDVS